ncbi:MAG: thermosome subunit beta [Thermoplasmata archaeon]|jgi:thermosome|nr:thermosome subunit [Euryarchaeota archaeon]MVT36190.1 thermosome subunit [Euryarchaeota archaeon]
MMAGQPILILKEGTKRETGRDAMKNNIQAAIAIAEAVRSTLGPRGMDKMLVDSLGDVVITNDGVTIMKEIEVEHPAAKMMVEVAKTQDTEVGDGTTTAVMLAGELLKQAQQLLEQNVHPTVISTGYRMAAEKAKEILEKISRGISEKDDDVLKKIAMTALGSKGASMSKDLLADISVKAVKKIIETVDGKRIADLNNVQVVKKQGGSIDDTQIIDGIIVDKEKAHPDMPQVVKNAKIALLNAALEIKKPEIDTNIQIRDPSMIHSFLEEEEKMLKEMVEKIAATGANVVFSQKGIDDMAQHFLAKKGIYAARRVKKSDMEKLEKATGAKIVMNLDDLTPNDLGQAEKVEEIKIGEDHLTFVTGCKNPKAVSILVRGGTEHVVDEIERSIQDALHVVAKAIEDGKVVTGAGSAAIEISLGLREYASSVGGREQLAIEKFADAMEIVPRTLSENAGLDPIDMIISLRKAHKDGNKNHGVNVFSGQIEDMWKLGVIEPIRVGQQAIDSATEAAVMILRIDDVVAAKGGAAGAKQPEKKKSEESESSD